MNLYNNNIKFMHFRNFVGGKPTSRGGLTIAYYVEDGKYIWAEAKCSKNDNFSRREGRAWAVKRLPTTNGRYPFRDIGEFRDTMERYAMGVFGYQRQYGKNKYAVANGGVLKNAEAA